MHQTTDSRLPDACPNCEQESGYELNAGSNSVVARCVNCETELRRLAFEVYRDDSTPEYSDDLDSRFFAVLTGPGPDTPRGTIAEVQDWTEANEDLFSDLENGEGADPAGHVLYVPGKDSGKVVSITEADR